MEIGLIFPKHSPHNPRNPLFQLQDVRSVLENWSRRLGEVVQVVDDIIEQKQIYQYETTWLNERIHCSPDAIACPYLCSVQVSWKFDHLHPDRILQFCERCRRVRHHTACRSIWGYWTVCWSRVRLWAEDRQCWLRLGVMTWQIHQWMLLIWRQVVVIEENWNELYHGTCGCYNRCQLCLRWMLDEFDKQMLIPSSQMSLWLLLTLLVLVLQLVLSSNQWGRFPSLKSSHSALLVGVTVVTQWAFDDTWFPLSTWFWLSWWSAGGERSVWWERGGRWTVWFHW